MNSASKDVKLSYQQLRQMLTGSLALILLGGGGLIYTMNSQINDVQFMADNKEAQLGSSEQVMSRYQDTYAAYQDTLQQLHYLEASHAANDYIPTLLQQLHASAEAAHLTITAMRPTTPPPAPAVVVAAKPSSESSSSGSSSSGTTTAQKKAPPPDFDTITVSIESTGTYQNLMAFMYGLTKFPKVVAVNSVQMQPGADTAHQTDPVLTATLRISAFVFHDDTPAPATVTASVPPAPASAAPASPVTIHQAATPAAANPSVIQPAGAAPVKAQAQGAPAKPENRIS